MTPARDPKQHFWKPLGKHLCAIWEAFGSHLGSIWELEAEEAFFLPDRTTWIRSIEGHTRLNTSCSQTHMCQHGWHEADRLLTCIQITKYNHKAHGAKYILKHKGA